MTDYDVAVIGNGIAGATASVVFAAHGFKVALISKTELLGGYGTNGLQYVPDTAKTNWLLSYLGINNRIRTVEERLLWNGEFWKYPLHLHVEGHNLIRQFGHSPTELQMILQTVHSVKTRKTWPEYRNDDWLLTCMNDPWNRKESEAILDCDPSMKNPFSLGYEMRRFLDDSENVYYVDANVSKIQTDGDLYHLYLDDYDVLNLPYGVPRVVSTVPVFVLPKILEDTGIDLSTYSARKASCAIVKVEKKPDWDYCYTPVTPYNLIHRMSYSKYIDSLVFELSFDLEGDTSNLTKQVLEDIRFIADGYLNIDSHFFEGIKLQTYPGHLVSGIELPLHFKNNFHLIGRYARWNSRIRINENLDDAFEIVNMMNDT